MGNIYDNLNKRKMVVDYGYEGWDNIVGRAGYDTQKMYNRYNYNYTLFSYNRYKYNYFKKNNSRYNYKYRIFLVDTS